MKVSDLFPGLKKPDSDKPKIVIANRAPNEKDAVNAQWWYDRSQKIMYRANGKSYVKD